MEAAIVKEPDVQVTPENYHSRPYDFFSSAKVADEVLNNDFEQLQYTDPTNPYATTFKFRTNPNAMPKYYTLSDIYICLKI